MGPKILIQQLKPGSVQQVANKPGRIQFIGKPGLVQVLDFLLINNSIPANAMLWDDGTPMLWDGGSTNYMTWD